MLNAKLMGLAPGQGEASLDGVHALLLKAMDPPHSLSITNAVELLTAIGCLDENEMVTPLGEALCQLPVDPCMGRVVLMSALFGALPSMLRVASAMGYRYFYLIVILINSPLTIYIPMQRSICHADIRSATLDAK